jgi:hypothetical protein
MDINIQVCAVYVDGTVRIYGQEPKDRSDRQFVKAMKFPSYGKALHFAREFEDKQVEDFVEQQRKKRLSL